MWVIILFILHFSITLCTTDCTTFLCYFIDNEKGIIITAPALDLGAVHHYVWIRPLFCMDYSIIMCG